MNDLHAQVGDRKNVEILGVYDNKRRTLGEKRQAMVQMAIGDYVVFIDDDDRVAPTYVNDIMDAIDKNPDCDCVVFDCICTVNGKETYCKYGVEFQYTNHAPPNGKWFGKPAHTMVYKASIAKRHNYANVTFGEDIDWVKRACKDIRPAHQVRINKVLYYYDYNKQTSETRGPLAGDSLTAPQINL
jgi:glycosyltransferase involved in cell wall biosynthesis